MLVNFKILDYWIEDNYIPREEKVYFLIEIGDRLELCERDLNETI